MQNWIKNENELSQLSERNEDLRQQENLKMRFGANSYALETIYLLPVSSRF